MTELLNNYLYILILYFPLGAIGIWRWSVWITKKAVARKYRPVSENGYSNTLSIVVPVYNENPDIFQKALKSWEDNNPDEIIAVIDHIDTDCIKEFKKFQEQNKSGKLIITKRPGKREALSDGIKAAKYNIIALVDSDTIWDPNIKTTLLSPFKDKLVGGVGPRQDVLDTNTLARRLFNIHLDHRYFDEMTYLATVANALTCLSGRTALYKKEAIKDLREELENETFWGSKCISGDDKCITRLVQERGWRVRYQANARVLTPGAPDLLTLFKQHIRWTRNSYRSDLKSLMSKWIWKREKFLAFHMIDRFTQPFTLMLGPIYFVFSIIWEHWLVAGILLAWWHLSRGIKLYPHLKHRPSDILILPFYILTTYLMAILKIYAMVTIRQQGWITRWDKNRLQEGYSNVFRAIKSTMPYFATVSIIILLSFGVTKYKNVTAVSELSTIKFSDIENIDTEQHKQNILNNLENQQFGHYTIKEDDTLSKIAWRYNGDVDKIIEANKETIQNPDYINPGQLIVIPVSELRNTLDNNNLISYREPEIIFDEVSNTINVKGGGSVVNLSKIYKALNNEQILGRLENNEWILRKDLFIGKEVTFVLDGDEVSWLKLLSEHNNITIIRSYNGRILIKNTKVTSWNESNQNYDLDAGDGRSLILAKYDGRMDIINSEMAYLGYGYYGVYEQGQPYGGSYGISWKIPNNSFKEYLITGNVINNKIHHNYFGLYTYGVTGMIFYGNEVYDNVEYGFDPHDDSNNLIIENNKSYNNGNHGIIISKRCFNNIIRNNVSYNNKLHGIMLDRQSNNNLVENNITYGNVDGVVMYDSHNNLIRNNEIKDNQNGVRANIGSAGNYIEQNKITNNENGVFLYDNADNNFVVGNLIKDNIKGVYVKNAVGNLIKNSLKNDYNERGIKNLTKQMAILSKKYNKLIFLAVVLISSIVLLNQFLNKSEVKESEKIKNFAVEQKQILIDKSEDVATLGYSGQRKIAKDTAGNFYIAYRKKYNGYYEIFVAKLTKGENEKWLVSGTDNPIAFIKSDQRVPSITIDSQNILHLVWYGSDIEDERGNRQIKYSKSIDGGKTWDNWKNISPVLGYSGNDYWQEHPNMFGGSDDELYVVWEGKDIKNNHQQIKFSKSMDSGQSWQNWINIGVSSKNSQSRPTIVQDKNGRLHVLMYSFLGGQAQQIQYSYSDDDGNNWSVWQNVSDSSFDSRHISVSIDKYNNLHAVWRAKYNDSKPTQIYYSVLENGKWQKPVIVAESVNNQFFPNITIDESNAPFIVWVESEKDYGFPKEWPEKGKIYASYFLNKEDRFSNAEQLSFENDNLYPNFLFKTDNFKNFPFIYTKIKNSVSEIILDWATNFDL